MVLCNFCRRTLPEHASYCDECGKPIPTEGAETEPSTIPDIVPVATDQRGGVRGFIQRGPFIPWLAGLLSFFAGQLIGEYFCYWYMKL